MLRVPEKATLLTIKIHLQPETVIEFSNWQEKLHGTIVNFPGFVSLEIRSTDLAHVWTIVQRFNNFENLSAWRTSTERKDLVRELQPLLSQNETESIQESVSEISNSQNHVTEVFVTQVSPGKENVYHEWISKIHKVEASFPGFRGVYVQSPSAEQGRNWITLLQFDTQENLDHWLSSPERAAILQESKPFIDSIENHRVISPYGGWFASVTQNGKVPSAWKQTMLVLLVLFPVVMLEMKYLSPLIANLNSSLATFIGNAISVTLIAWPLMPIALYFLGWWVNTKGNSQQRTTLLGTGLVLALYLLEILIFWKLL